MNNLPEKVIAKYVLITCQSDKTTLPNGTITLNVRNWEAFLLKPYCVYQCHSLIIIAYRGTLWFWWTNLFSFCMMVSKWFQFFITLWLHFLFSAETLELLIILYRKDYYCCTTESFERFEKCTHCRYVLCDIYVACNRWISYWQPLGLFSFSCLFLSVLRIHLSHFLLTWASFKY